MKIKDVVEMPYSVLSTYKKMIAIWFIVTPDICFWVAWIISVRGYVGSYPLDALMQRVDRLVCENYEFSKRERLIGNQLVARLNILDNESEQELSSKWFITRFFARLREQGLSYKRDIGAYYN